jgi:hypothetical protein
MNRTGETQCARRNQIAVHHLTRKPTARIDDDAELERRTERALKMLERRFRALSRRQIIKTERPT